MERDGLEHVRLIAPCAQTSTTEMQKLPFELRSSGSHSHASEDRHAQHAAHLC